jgi:very-short-patch-repair endonuclease
MKIYQDSGNEMYFGASSEIIRRARELRNSMTDSEKRLWYLIRNRQIDGYKFRRQHPVNQFIVDFYCVELKLSIEIDGSIHLNPEQNERDEQRTKIINSLGIIELRFSNEEVNNNSTFVIQSLRTSIAKLISNSTNPTREP